MTRYLLLFALALGALTGYAQTTTTISYAGLSLSQSSSNVFASPVYVDGYAHQTLIWDNQNYNSMSGPAYNGSAVVLQADSYEGDYGGTETHPTAGLYLCQDAYSIGYAFYPNYTYSITMNVGPLTIPTGYTAGLNFGLALTYGTPQYTKSVNNTGFGTYVDEIMDDWDVMGTTWSPHVYSQALYMTPAQQPFYANWLSPTASTENVSIGSFTVPAVEEGINIEAFGNPWANNGNLAAPSFPINSISITQVPNILPVPYTSPNVSFVCDTQTYSVSTTYPVTWSVSPAGLVTLKQSGSNGNYVQVVRTQGEYGNVTLTATMNGMTATDPISVGSVTSATETENGSCDNGYQAWQLAATANSPTAANWNWVVTLDNGPYEFTAQNAPDVTVSIDGRLELSVSYVDGCGYTSEPTTVVVYSNCNEPESIHFDASPNPASTSVEILPHHSPGGGVTPLINEIKVFDMQGRIRSDVHYGGTTQQQVSVSNLENGLYFVLIYMQDGKVERKKILVQHD